jgi:hypothetical protein
VSEHARRHRAVAVDERSVELQLLGEMREHGLRRGIVRLREPRRRGRPQLGQRATRPARDERANFLLEAQHVPAQPLAIDALRRDLLQHLVDD